MSDKKEIATLSIKISVDSTDLDKLEAQLERIAGLMVSTGLKQPAKGGFTSDSFGIFNPNGRLEPVFVVPSRVAFINDVYIGKALLKAVNIGAKEGAEQATFTLKSSAAVTRLDKTTSREESDLEKFKQQVESEFSQLQSSIIAIQHTQASFDKANAIAIEQIRSDIQSAKSGWL